MVGDTNIRPPDVVKNLSSHDDISVEQATELLNPADKQNVPKAVALIQRLHNLQDLALPPGPTDAKMRQTVVFFSKFLSLFVFQYVKTEMSVSEQIHWLATYACMAAALQIRHGTGCLTGPLYSDSQSVVKNVVFTTARLQLLDLQLKFYIILEGTDRLEPPSTACVFSNCRTQDHAKNFDIAQLAAKLATATLIDAAFLRHPDLDRGHTRLNLTGAIGVDHVNPKSWKGNVCVKYVNIRKEWDTAMVAANNKLVEYFGPSGFFDFRIAFFDRTKDLLRPAGVYVGLKPTPDDKRSEQESHV
ncbi:hypothetical protein B0H14DRAFT_2338170 [Mycena olivaceomarginata]|nr:hypothetical protein B0H14DRAFT_2338170 [Mycena olivaceomarginata]